jgi:hypothetical protein
MSEKKQKNNNNISCKHTSVTARLFEGVVIYLRQPSRYIYDMNFFVR